MAPAISRKLATTGYSQRQTCKSSSMNPLRSLCSCLRTAACVVLVHGHGACSTPPYRQPRLYMRSSLRKVSVTVSAYTFRLYGSLINYFTLLLLWPPCVAVCGHYIFALWFLLSSSSIFSFSSPNLSRRRLDVYHTSTRGVALVRI